MVPATPVVVTAEVAEVQVELVLQMIILAVQVYNHQFQEQQHHTQVAEAVGQLQLQQVCLLVQVNMDLVHQEQQVQLTQVVVAEAQV